MKRLLRFGIPVLIIVVAFFGMRMLLGMRETRPPHAAPPRPLRVNTQVAQLVPTPTEILAYGRVRSAQPLDLFSEVTGIIEAGDRPFRDGQRFERGDLLIRIDDRSLKLRIASRKSQLLSALAGVLPEIKVDFPDEFPIWQGYFNDLDIEGDLSDLPPAGHDRVRLFLARHRIHEIYYDIREMEILLEKHEFIAPFGGVIVDAALREGATARAGSRVGAILGLDELEVEVSLPAADLTWIEQGGVVRLRNLEQGTNYSANIARIGGILDPKTETVSVYLSIGDAKASDAGSLVDGVFLEARFPGRTIAAAVALPQEALQSGESVYLLSNGKLERRSVSVARREERRVLIAEGLAEGDSVVTDLLQGVAPGMPASARNSAREDQQ